MERLIGLREMRANASDIVRQAEAGEKFVVTVHGREVAELGPRQPRTWRTWNQVAALLDRPLDLELAEDLRQVAGPLEDPWTRR